MSGNTLQHQLNTIVKRLWTWAITNARSNGDKLSPMRTQHCQCHCRHCDHMKKYSRRLNLSSCYSVHYKWQWYRLVPTYTAKLKLYLPTLRRCILSRCRIPKTYFWQLCYYHSPQIHSLYGHHEERILCQAETTHSYFIMAANRRTMKLATFSVRWCDVHEITQGLFNVWLKTNMKHQQSETASAKENLFRIWTPEPDFGSGWLPKFNGGYPCPRLYLW